MALPHMSPTELIDCYVADVARRLPASKRNDVGFELKALLGEELRGRAGDAGRLPDEAIAIELLRGFGHPEEVADRYRPQGLTIIPPSASGPFAVASLVGLALQWAVTLPIVFTATVQGGADVWSRLGVWWVSGGLGALWWPGFLVVCAMIGAWAKRRWPSQQLWKPRAIDRDTISRPTWAIGLAAALAGIAFWVSFPWAADHLLDPRIARVFAFAPNFLTERAPWVVGFWIAHVGLVVLIMAEGRWRPLTRRIDIGLNVLACLLIGWLLTRPVFAMFSTDWSARSLTIAFVLLPVVVATALKVRREMLRLRPPVAAAKPSA